MRQFSGKKKEAFFLLSPFFPPFLPLVPPFLLPLSPPSSPLFSPFLPRFFPLPSPVFPSVPSFPSPSSPPRFLSFPFFPRLSSLFPPFGIVQKVFSEKASAIARMRQKCVRNASEMRQKCVRNASKRVLFYWEQRNVPKCVRNASNLRQKCAEHLWGRTPFGRYRPLSSSHFLPFIPVVFLPFPPFLPPSFSPPPGPLGFPLERTDFPRKMQHSLHIQRTRPY